MKACLSRINRRSFLTSGAIGLGLTLSPRSNFMPAAVLKNPTSPEDFKRQLRGPILSVPTTYTSDFKVDYDGMRRMIERAAKAGVGAITNETHFRKLISNYANGFVA